MTSSRTFELLYDEDMPADAIHLATNARGELTVTLPREVKRNPGTVETVLNALDGGLRKSLATVIDQDRRIAPGV